MKHQIPLIAAGLLSLASCREESMESLTCRVFDLAEKQCLLMEEQLPSDRAPRTYTPQGIFVSSHLSWWCSGFYPGTLWLVYDRTGNETIREYAVRNCHKIDDVRACMSGHDLGFQYWCGDGRAWQSTADSTWLPTIREAARLLAERFSPTTGCIRSWGDDTDPEFRVIIDNMMNLELLMEASKLFGCDSLVSIAKTHANTTLANHFRADGTSYHLVCYNPSDGSVVRKVTVQGYADESAWARGQAWALYGYTMMYRETSDPAYLAQACKVADCLIPRLPEDGIPYWDYDCPAIPYTYKDASAGAVMASGLVELSTLCPDRAKSRLYRRTAERQIRSLCSPDYLAGTPGSNGCFLLRHSVGNLHGDANKRILEIDAPLSYADYYLLEALTRYAAL